MRRRRMVVETEKVAAAANEGVTRREERRNRVGVGTTGLMAIGGGSPSPVVSRLLARSLATRSPVGSLPLDSIAAAVDAAVAVVAACAASLPPLRRRHHHHHPHRRRCRRHPPPRPGQTQTRRGVRYRGPRLRAPGYPSCSSPTIRASIPFRFPVPYVDATAPWLSRAGA